MVLLVLGVILWSGAHWLPIGGRSLRTQIVTRVGIGPYKGLFSLTILFSIVLMVLGWRSCAMTPLYSPASWSRLVANALMGLSLVLLVASVLPNNLRRWLRHPQLSSVVAWSAAHLIANGDARSIVLFGGLGLWAIASMSLTNRRDGAWVKAEGIGAGYDLLALGASAVLFWLIRAGHPWIAGVSALP